MSVGQNIYNLRKNINLSQEQLAEKLGVTRQTISNWELEESVPDLKQAKELSKIFKVSLDELISNLVLEYNGGIARKLTIVSKIENVIVTCDRVISSSEYKGGKTSPKYALFSSLEDGKNIFLGWYASKDDLSNEIEEIKNAFMLGNSSYELKYNVPVTKKLFGLRVNIKENKNEE